jgi:hypothetical protein
VMRKLVMLMNHVLKPENLKATPKNEPQPA